MPVEKLLPLDEWFEYCDDASVLKFSQASDKSMLADLANSTIRLESSLADNVVLSPHIKSFIENVTAKTNKSVKLMHVCRPRKSRDGYCGFCDRVIHDSGEADCRYKTWIYTTNICQSCYVGIFCDDSLSEFHRFLNFAQVYWGYVTDAMIRYLGGMKV